MKDPSLRALELSSTGSPCPYEVDYACLVQSPRNVEQQAHRHLHARREGKEWFAITAEEAIVALKTAASGRVFLEEFRRADRERTAALENQRREEVERALLEKARQDDAKKEAARRAAQLAREAAEAAAVLQNQAQSDRTAGTVFRAPLILGLSSVALLAVFWFAWIAPRVDTPTRSASTASPPQANVATVPPSGSPQVSGSSSSKSTAGKHRLLKSYRTKAGQLQLASTSEWASVLLLHDAPLADTEGRPTEVLKLLSLPDKDVAVVSVQSGGSAGFWNLLVILLSPDGRSVVWTAEQDLQGRLEAIEKVGNQVEIHIGYEKKLRKVVVVEGATVRTLLVPPVSTETMSNDLCKGAYNALTECTSLLFKRTRCDADFSAFSQVSRNWLRSVLDHPASDNDALYVACNTACSTGRLPPYTDFVTSVCRGVSM